MSSRSRRRPRPAATPASEEPGDRATDPPSDTRSPAEDEVWQAFREENVEVLEQLPATLERNYGLMRELDEKAQDYIARLHSEIRRYLAKRRSLQPAAPPPVHEEQTETAGHTGAEPLDSEPPVDVQRANRSPSQTSEQAKVDASEPLREHTPEISAADAKNDKESNTDINVEETAQVAPLDEAGVTSTIHDADAPSDIENVTTRAILQLIGFLSSEAVRVSEEKHSIAESSYNVVDRHVRLLDQMIDEQETALKLGIREGTLPAPIAGRRGGRGGTRGGARTRGATLIRLPPRGPKRERGGPDGAFTSGPLGLAGVEVNPNEPRYCYCNNVSWGEMVACEKGEHCVKGEWFHLSCVGLHKAPPKGQPWFCPECRPDTPPQRIRKKTRR